jgi:hypothetical protein
MAERGAPGTVQRANWGLLIRNVLSLLSAGAGAIRFAVVQSHFEEYWLYGVFFSALGWFQVGWAILVVAQPSRSVDLLGGLVNAGVVVLWVVTRTIGIPIGPEAGSPEEAQFADVLATVFEILLVAGIFGLFQPRLGRRSLRPSRLVAGTISLGLVVTLLTSAAMLSFSPHHGDQGPETGEEHEEPVNQ